MDMKMEAKAFAGELAAVTKSAIAKAVDPLVARLNELEARVVALEQEQGISPEDVEKLLKE